MDYNWDLFANKSYFKEHQKKTRKKIKRVWSKNN